jgi:hypothetical protein
MSHRRAVQQLEWQKQQIRAGKCPACARNSLQVGNGAGGASRNIERGRRRGTTRRRPPAGVGIVTARSCAGRRCSVRGISGSSGRTVSSTGTGRRPRSGDARIRGLHRARCGPTRAEARPEAEARQVRQREDHSGRPDLRQRERGAAVSGTAEPRASRRTIRGLRVQPRYTLCALAVDGASCET